MTSHDSTVETDPTRARGSLARPARMVAAAYFLLAAIGLAGTW